MIINKLLIKQDDSNLVSFFSTVGLYSEDFNVARIAVSPNGEYCYFYNSSGSNNSIGILLDKDLNVYHKKYSYVSSAAVDDYGGIYLITNYSSEQILYYSNLADTSFTKRSYYASGSKTFSIFLKDNTINAIMEKGDPLYGIANTSLNKDTFANVTVRSLSTGQVSASRAYANKDFIWALGIATEPYHYFLMKLNLTTNYEYWKNDFTHAYPNNMAINSPYENGVTTDSSGNIYVVYTYLYYTYIHKVDTNGNTVYVKKVRPNNISGNYGYYSRIVWNDGKLFLLTLFTTDYTKVYITELDENCTHVKTFCIKILKNDLTATTVQQCYLAVDANFIHIAGNLGINIIGSTYKDGFYMRLEKDKEFSTFVGDALTLSFYYDLPCAISSSGVTSTVLSKDNSLSDTQTTISAASTVAFTAIIGTTNIETI